MGGLVLLEEEHSHCPQLPHPHCSHLQSLSAAAAGEESHCVLCTHPAAGDCGGSDRGTEGGCDGDVSGVCVMVL